MKEKIVKYDDVVTVYNGEEFNHGTIEYKSYPDRKDKTKIEFLSLKIDIGCAILPDKSDNFVADLTKLIDKYAV